MERVGDTFWKSTLFWSTSIAAFCGLMIPSLLNERYMQYRDDHTTWHNLHQELCLMRYQGSERGSVITRSSWDGRRAADAWKFCPSGIAALIENEDLKNRDRIAVGDTLLCDVGIRESPNWSLLYTESETAIKECR